MNKKTFCLKTSSEHVTQLFIESPQGSRDETYQLQQTLDECPLTVHELLSTQ